MMEGIVLETLDLLKPLLTNDPFLSNMDHAKLLLRPPMRYVYDLVMAISLSFPALRKSLTLSDRNRNLALKNEASQREFFQKISRFVQAKDSGSTCCVSSMFDAEVFLKGKGAKQTNSLLQKLAKMATESNAEVNDPKRTGRKNLGVCTSLSEVKKPSKRFVGNILRPKSITLGSSASKVIDRRETTTTSSTPADGGSAMPEAASACSFRQQVRRISTVPSLFPDTSKTAPTASSHPLPSLMNSFPAREDELPDEDFALPIPEFPAHPEFLEREPVSTDNFANLLRDMRELADSIKDLKLQNSSILKDLTSADQTMRATSRSLKLLDTYSSIKDNIKYAETMA